MELNAYLKYKWVLMLELNEYEKKEKLNLLNFAAWFFRSPWQSCLKCLSPKILLIVFSWVMFITQDLDWCCSSLEKKMRWVYILWKLRIVPIFLWSVHFLFTNDLTRIGRTVLRDTCIKHNSSRGRIETRQVSFLFLLESLVRHVLSLMSRFPSWFV